MSADVWRGFDIDTCFGFLKSARVIALHKIRGSPSLGWTYASLQSKLARLGLLLEQLNFSDPTVRIPQSLESRLSFALDRLEDLVLDEVRASTEEFTTSQARLAILASLESTRGVDESAKYLFLEKLQDEDLSNEVLDNVEGLLDALERCERPTAAPEPITPHEPVVLGDHDPWSVLFNHLSSHVITCPTREELHSTRLFLGALADEADVLRLLCSHSDGQRWHAIDFHAETLEGDINHSRNKEDQSDISTCKLCDLTVKPPTFRAHKFVYNSHGIWHARKGKLLEKERRNPHFQSLEDWLRAGQATRYRKTVQCILARWLGHLYGTPWLPQSWAMDSIWMDDTLAKDSCRTPYAGCRPWQSDEAFSNQVPDAAFMIRFGILMLRIEFPKLKDLLTIENEEDLDVEELDEQLQMFLENDDISEDLEVRLKQVLEACQNWDDSSPPERRVVFDKIFAPLEDELMSRFGLDVPDPPERVALPFQRDPHVPSIPEAMTILDFNKITLNDVPLPRLTPTSDCMLLYDDYDSAMDHGRIKRARTYFEHFDNFLSTHIDTLKIESRVKIAVLDTGVNENSLRGRLMEIKQRRNRSRCADYAPNPIAGKRSFVAGDPNVKDACGHGTRVLDLLLRTAPNAKFYVAKISITANDNDEDVAEYVIKALDWAIEEKVDLINMSFGFKESPQNGRLQSKVVEAYSKGIKMFAAAANHGRHMPRAFPADAEEVICINASCGSGSWAEEINPSSSDYSDSWNTLGVGIEFDESAGTTHRSGTSYATPLAVGSVANALDFVRVLQTEKLLTSDQARDQQTYKGVKKLMRLMSRDGFIAPWIFWDGDAEKDDLASRLKWKGK